jgi:hypothetical protein
MMLMSNFVFEKNESIYHRMYIYIISDSNVSQLNFLTGLVVYKHDRKLNKKNILEIQIIWYYIYIYHVKTEIYTCNYPLLMTELARWSHKNPILGKYSIS